METLIQITGVQYTCQENDIRAVLAELEQQKPEVLLVTEQTQDFGIIVRALTGTTPRGVVNRFDLEQVLGMMRHDGTSVLVGQVAETDIEGRCFTIRICGDYQTPRTASDNIANTWADWHWTGAPLMNSTSDDRRLDISLKVALAELRCSGRMNRQTLMEHLKLVLQLAKWDVSRETQEQLSEIRRLVSRHSDNDIRAIAPQLRHTLAAFGSKERISEFQNTYMPALCQSTEAEQMYRQWCNTHKAELSDIMQWQPTITQQLDAIDACLMKLPENLCYQKDLFGPLMHRLLYMNIPRRKLLMLLSAFVLRQLLRKQLGITEEDNTGNINEEERRLTQQLAPVFYGNTDYAREFLLLAKGQKTSDITTLVSLWVREKRICHAHCHRPLWTILHEAGIYKASESNWNMQLDIRKSWK